MWYQVVYSKKYHDTNDVNFVVSTLNKVSEIKSEETDEFLRFLCWFLVRYFPLTIMPQT